MNVHSTRKRIGVFTTLALACMITLGCSPKGVVIEEKEKKTETEISPTIEQSVEVNIKTIETVLQLELNGPDEQYIQLVNAAMDGMEDRGSVKQKEDEMRLTSYMKKKYLPYFSEDGLSRTESVGMLFQYQSFYTFEEEYQLRLLSSEVKQSEIDTASNQYLIKATVEFSTPGEEPSQHELEGKAIFSTKEGKIGYFQLGQKDQTLSKKILELGGGE